MTTAAKEGPRVASVAPWGIEADHPRNADLLIQSIPGCKLRGAVKASRTVVDQKTGEEMVPLDQSRHLGQLPSLPGMQLHVNPGKLTYKIIDPMYEDKDLCERLAKRMVSAEMAVSVVEIRGVPPQEGKLDVDRMKTLCREMLWIVNANEGRVVMGPKPELEDIDDLEGEYLLNPGSMVQWGQPLYEKDLPAYRQKVNQLV